MDNALLLSVAKRIELLPEIALDTKVIFYYFTIIIFIAIITVKPFWVVRFPIHWCVDFVWRGDLRIHKRRVVKCVQSYDSV